MIRYRVRMSHSAAALAAPESTHHPSPIPTPSSKLTLMAEPERDHPVGGGPAAKVSISMPLGSIQAVRRRVGAREFSSYVAAAVERQVERDLLQEAIDINIAEFGAIPDEALARGRELFESLLAQWKKSQEGV